MFHDTTSISVKSSTLAAASRGNSAGSACEAWLSQTIVTGIGRTAYSHPREADDHGEDGLVGLAIV